MGYGSAILHLIVILSVNTEHKKCVSNDIATRCHNLLLLCILYVSYTDCSLEMCHVKNDPEMKHFVHSFANGKLKNVI